MTAQAALSILENTFKSLNKAEKEKFLKSMPGIVGKGDFIEKRAEFFNEVDKAEAWLDNKFEKQYK